MYHTSERQWLLNVLVATFDDTILFTHATIRRRYVYHHLESASLNMVNYHKNDVLFATAVLGILAGVRALGDHLLQNFAYWHPGSALRLTHIRYPRTASQL